MFKKHPDRTSEWKKIQQILKEYTDKKSSHKETDNENKKPDT